jgi:hypothetical protein
MLEKTKTKSASGPRTSAAKTGKTKATAIKTASRTAGRKPAAPGWSREELYERIQRRAYELWEREGRPDGRDHAHWHQAELEITRAHTRAAA